MTLSATIFNMYETSALRGRIADRSLYTVLVDGNSYGPSKIATNRDLRQAILRRTWDANIFGILPDAAKGEANEQYDSYIIPNSPVYGAHMQDAYRAIIDLDTEMTNIKSVIWQLMNNYIGYHAIVEDPNFNVAQALYQSYVTGSISWGKIRKLERNTYLDGNYASGTDPYPHAQSTLADFGPTDADQSIEMILYWTIRSLAKISTIANGATYSTYAQAVKAITTWPDDPFSILDPQAPKNNLVAMVNWLLNQIEANNEILYGTNNAQATPANKLASIGWASTASTGVLTQQEMGKYQAGVYNFSAGMDSLNYQSRYYYSHTVVFTKPMAFGSFGQFPVIDVTLEISDPYAVAANESGITGPNVMDVTSNGFTFYITSNVDLSAELAVMGAHWNARVANQT